MIQKTACGLSKISLIAAVLLVSSFNTALGDTTQSRLSVGDAVTVSATLHVRSSAAVSSQSLGVIPRGSTGTIISGPRTAGEYVWWNIRYANGLNGWSAEPWLESKDTTVPKTSTLVPATTKQLPMSFPVPLTDVYEAGAEIEVEWTYGEWPTGLVLENILTKERTFWRDALSPSRRYTLSLPATIDPGLYRIVAYRYMGAKDRSEYEDFGVSRLISIKRAIDKVVWVRPDDAANICEYFTSNERYDILETRDASCEGSRCVSPPFVWVFGDRHINEDRPSYLPEDGILHQVKCSSSGSLPDDKISAGDTSDSSTLSRALGVGAYEGSYPNGDRHRYGYHPQGEITVELAAGSPADVGEYLLVLSSYEPVKWNITGPGVDLIGRVFTTGYYDQEVTGLSSSIEVDSLSQESGDPTYFFVYDIQSDEFTELAEYIEDVYQVRFSQFYGDYAQDKVIIAGYKG